jgi:hypothetical protein
MPYHRQREPEDGPFPQLALKRTALWTSLGDQNDARNGGPRETHKRGDIHRHRTGSVWSRHEGAR